MAVKKCNKFGPGWYRFDRISHFEYNPHVTEEKATAFGDISNRLPLGAVSNSVGNTVRAVVFRYRWSHLSKMYLPSWKKQKIFYSKKCFSEFDLFNSAVQWVEFHCVPENDSSQMDLFPEFAEQFVYKKRVKEEQL